ncbi:MAG: type III-A CRISPR-associated RAMP protein Csm3 [bacterium]|nr:type III-A CRISPR-associated RAMP protein Csm3 [bacterium]
MLTKVMIRGKLEVLTGMHIGGSSVFSAIGAVDSPVIKDAKSNSPMIPGSSLKGKMRTLLAKQYNTRMASRPDEDDESLTDLFGSSKLHKSSRVLFYDMIMDNWDDLRQQGVASKTEIKFENTISRTTGVANPRQIERVVRGASFPLEIVYELSGTGSVDEEKIKKDFEILCMGFKLLQYDYLGGNGSRGYGKVKITELSAKEIVGEVSEEIMTECNRMLAEVG